MGIQPVKFTSNNGETIEGTNLYCGFVSEGVDGLKCEKWFVKPEISIPECKMNDTVDVDFDHRGKIIQISK